ncbi:MAG TPA: flagellar motor protein MotB [Glycomyces sp.]|nr:flagellar motor protein MotB [Glycomyces sp.]
MPRPTRQNPADEQPTAPFWMATFSDMVTLLLAFFVMIVAMSEVEVQKFEEALSYFNGHTAMLKSSEITHVITPTHVGNHDLMPAQELQAQRYDSLLQRLAEADLGEAVQVNLTQRGVHVSIADSVMFASGEAELLPDARALLAVVAGVIEDDVKSVVVEGHTDSVPIQTLRFPSNWELSASRAAAVVRFLLAQEGALPPIRYQASGYGEFRPRAPNTTPDGRARNRRVEILLSSEPWPTSLLPPLPNP